MRHVVSFRINLQIFCHTNRIRINHYFQGGEREIVLGKDDELMEEQSRSIPRADVAELCIQALEQSEAQNRYTFILHLETCSIYQCP